MTPSDENGKEMRLNEHARSLGIERGLDFSHAHELAWLEKQLREPWPSAWGDALHVVIYGDFDPPDADLDFPSLGIEVKASPLENTASSGIYRTSLSAYVSIPERSVSAITDAARRINLLLGVFNLVSWGQAGSDWWCHLTHSGGGVIEQFGKQTNLPGIPEVLAAIDRIPAPARQKVESALYWIRDPVADPMLSPRNGVLRQYAGYWNAFECLVGAINDLRPLNKLTRADKQKAIDEFLAARNGVLTAEDVIELQRVVSPGLVEKASHALRQSCGNQAERYVVECFKTQRRRDRLYDIRNAINHGEIDAANVDELMRVDGRLGRLRLIVMRMFAALVPFSCPADFDMQWPLPKDGA